MILAVTLRLETLVLLIISCVAHCYLSISTILLFMNITHCSLTAIGAFTVTLFAVSRGRLESLVGKRFAAGGLRVYFAGIHSLFAFISLTNKIMIMFCIGSEYIEHCSDGWFYLFIIQKRENEENFG